MQPVPEKNECKASTHGPISSPRATERRRLAARPDPRRGIEAGGAVPRAAGRHAGGAAAAVREVLAEEGIVMPVMHIGLPDRFIDHASHSQQLNNVGLDSAGILQRIEQRLDTLQLPKKAAQQP